jgi:hypothetical protein
MRHHNNKSKTYLFREISSSNPPVFVVAAIIWGLGVWWCDFVFVCAERMFFSFFHLSLSRIEIHRERERERERFLMK